MNKLTQVVTMKRMMLVTFAASLWLLAGMALEQSPNEMIEEAVDLLAESMDGRKEELASDKKALYSMINDILLPRFDRRYAAGLVLGKYWRTASDEQRQRFTEAFYRTLLQRYADGLLDFEQDRVEILPFRGDLSKNRTIVKTIVRLNDGTKVPVNYSLSKKEMGWQMFDVSIEGISYVRNFRAELDSEIRATSIPKMIERLEADAGISGGE